MLPDFLYGQIGILVILIVLIGMTLFLFSPAPPPPSNQTSRTSAPVPRQRPAPPPLPAQQERRRPAPALPAQPPQISRTNIYHYPKCPMCRLRNVRGKPQQVFACPEGFRCRSGHYF